jgi:hypothetical protein
MRGKIVFIGLILSLSGLSARAQSSATPFPTDVYCSGLITTDAVPQKTFVVSGEQSNTRLTFTLGDVVYLNKGSDEGAKIGDEFSIIRSVDQRNFLDEEWSKWQYDIISRMGTLWADEGRIKIVEVLPKTSVAVIDHMCDSIQRGDIAVPFTQQPALTLRPFGQFDRFAPPNGKSLAMVMVGANYRNELGRNDVMYVNLGNSQGVHVGDYFRIFRYTGTEHETAYQTPRYAFDLQYGGKANYGFGAVPSKYDWSNTPREVLGEGIVLRTGPNSATVLITFSTREIYAGDYVELE